MVLSFNIIHFLENWGINTRVLVIIVGTILGAILLTRFSRWFINKAFLAASKKLKVDPTRYRFFKNGISLLIWLMAFAIVILMIPELKAFAITIFAGAGILVAILGFAAQQAFSNIISGVFIVIFRPFRVGDMIKVGDREYGIVEDINLRHTIITSFENKRIIIPNSIISSETIINDFIEDQKVCRFVELGISYDSDIDKAMTIMQEEAMKHPRCIDARTKEQKSNNIPQVLVRVLGFGDSSVNLRAYVWTDDPFNAIQLHSDINKAVKQRFDREGIEIPFPYRTIVYKKDIS